MAAVTSRTSVPASERSYEPQGRGGCGRKEEEKPPVRSDEEAPEAVRKRVGEPLARVPGERLAEADDLEREPDRGRSRGAGGARGEPTAPKGRRVKEREKEEWRDGGEARLHEDRDAGGGAGAGDEANRRTGLALACRPEGECEGSGERSRLERLGEVRRGVRAEGRAERGQEDGGPLGRS